MIEFIILISIWWAADMIIDELREIKKILKK